MTRQYLTILTAMSVAGCSLIYSPSNLPNKEDLAIDAQIADADPTLLRLDEIKSGPLLEGAGQSGAPKQILVVFGEHIAPDAVVTHASTATVAMTDVKIAADGNSFAALVSAPYMDTMDEGTMIPVTIKVTQAGIERTIEWQLKALDQILDGGARDVPPAGKQFSRIAVSGEAIAFNRGDAKAIVKVVGGISVTGAGAMVTANALGREPGAGGCLGGAANAAGACFGSGKPAGGGAGFAGPGVAGTGIVNVLPGGPGGGAVGDELIVLYGDGGDPTMNRSAGGGGGGAVGGGGGGTIELTAGGDLEVTAVQAVGGNGAGGGLGHGGGGGAGGVVVLRAGGKLTFPTVNVNPGSGGGGTGQGGAGSVGRWRYDAATTMGSAPAGGRRGPMFVAPPNPIYSGMMKAPTLTLANEGGIEVTIITIRPDGMASESIDQMTVGAMSPVQVPPLAIGINKVCAIVPGGSVANDEATNCIEVAFVP